MAESNADRLKAMAKAASKAAVAAQRQGDRREAVRQVEKAVALEKVAKHAGRRGW